MQGGTYPYVRQKNALTGLESEGKEKFRFRDHSDCPIRVRETPVRSGVPQGKGYNYTVHYLYSTLTA